MSENLASSLPIWMPKYLNCLAHINWVAGGPVCTWGSRWNNVDLSQLIRIPKKWMIFRYFQLRHEVRAQFSTPLNLRMDPIEKLLAQDSLLKPLSALYLDLLSVDSPKMDHLWDRWKADIPNLDSENWEDCLGDSAKLLISSRIG